MPSNVTDCGLLGALSVSMSDAVRFPVAVGSKVTLITQLRPGAIEEPQLLVCAKSWLFVPVMPIEAVNGMFPMLLSFTPLAELEMPTACFPKFRLVGEIWAIAPFTNWLSAEVPGLKLSSPP